MFKKKNSFILISLLIGAIIFIVAYGVKIINPVNTDWIFLFSGDTAQAYIGWQFFRNSPFMFPLGIFDSLTYPIETSIINTDSTPLFAVFFKIFSNILSKNFQYIGLFGVICFMLQCLLGTLICRKFTSHKKYKNIIAILGGTLICLTPSLFHRYLMHISLSAHWMILLSFIPIVYYEKFVNKKRDILLYSLLGFLTVSIHTYYTAFCGIIVLFYSIYKLIKTKSLISFIPCIGYIIAAVLSTWIFGGFAMNAIIAGEGLNVFSFNLINFFNPLYLSCIFPKLNTLGGQYEGYSYLGLGVFFLLIIALFSLKDIFKAIQNNKMEASLWGLIIITTFFLALSPCISVGTKIIANIPIPNFIENIWSIFRSTGRFIFITNYTIVILLLMFICSRFKEKSIIAIMILTIGLQAYDMHKFFSYTRSFLSQDLVHETSLKNVIWSTLSNNNKINLVHLPPNWETNDYVLLFDITQWILKNNHKINSFYPARPLKYIDEIYTNNLSNPPENDLFLFIDKKASNHLIQQSNLKYFYKTDGIILASKRNLKGLENIEINYNYFE